MPPSPVVMFFVSWSEQAPSAPMVPVARPRYETPIDCAASSRIGMSWRVASAVSASMSHATFSRWTGTIAAVCSEIFASTSAGSSVSVSSTSANTTSAPIVTTALTVAMNVNAGTITSSPGPTSNAANATRNAAVPLETASAYRQPNASHTADSNASTRAGVRGRVVPEERSIAQHLGDRVDLVGAELVDALPEWESARDRGGPPVDRRPIRFHAAERSARRVPSSVVDTVRMQRRPDGSERKEP